MYVVRGGHPVYDCFDCQRLDFSRSGFDATSTKWSVSLGDERGRQRVRSANYTLHQAGPNNFVTRYSLFGMPVEEHYHVLDATFN